MSTTVSSGQTFFVSGSDSGATVLGGGILIIDGGGTETSATIDAGGFEFVSSGGIAGATLVETNGFVTVSSGGTGGSNTIAGGGSELVMSGGTVEATRRALSLWRVSATRSSSIEDVRFEVLQRNINDICRV